MADYKVKLNPFTGQLQLVLDETSIGILNFEPGVPTVADLPLIGNHKNDARIVNDTHHLYVWDGAAWQDEGDIIDIDWAAITGKPTSPVADIDDAVSKRHTQNTDQKLDEGGANEVIVADIKDAVDKRHEHLNKALLDTYTQLEIDLADAVDKKHSQNTDVALRTDKLTVDASGNTEIVGELKIKVYSQDAEPTLGADQRLAIWIDTDDSNKVYLIFRRGTDDQVSVELS